MEAAGPIASVESWVAGAVHVVRITTADGESGLGQSACWAYPEAVAAVVAELRQHLVGAPAGEIERHWHRLNRAGPFRGSIISAAISAIDIALWDLKGRHHGIPVFELLGGRCRDRLRLHLLLGEWKSYEELAELTRDAIREGFTAVKVDPLPAGYQDLAFPTLLEAVSSAGAAVREAAGPDVDLIFELHRGLDAICAQSVIQELARFAPLFIEDPIQIDSIDLQGAIAAGASGVSIGQGERLHSSWEVRELLQRGGPQYVRTDVGLAGGISQARKIAAVAEAFGAKVCFHTWSGPIVSAAAAHVELSVPNTSTHEWWPAFDEPGRIPGLASHCSRDGGWLQVDDSPGLGVDFDEATFKASNGDSNRKLPVPYRRDGSVAWSH